MNVASTVEVSATTRKRMQATRQRDTDCEMLVRRALWARGLRYRVNLRISKSITSRPDIVFSRARVALFINGCYWHACPLHGTVPKTNSQWWSEKFEANRARDQRADATLRSEGWTVIRAWEHEEPNAVANTVAAALQQIYDVFESR